MTFPEKFYKYRSLASQPDVSRAEDIIKTSSLWFPSPDSFNDPFDCRPIFEMNAAPAVLRRYLLGLSRLNRPAFSRKQHEAYVSQWMSDPKRDPRSPELLEFMRTAHEHRLTKSLGVLCVSATGSDILMWSHYADCHRGLCLEFSSAYSPFENADVVVYDSERVPVNLVIEDENTMAKKSVFSKSAQWEYEQEWRVILKTGPQLVKFNPKALTAVILGTQIDPKKAASVQSWLIDRPDVQIYRAVPDKRTYSVGLVSV